MPGPEHGAINLILNEQLTEWRRSNDTLKKYLAGGLSSGGAVNRRYRGFEPDRRIFPTSKYRDPVGADSDGSNKGCPYSRFILEIEYENREPIQVRERGELYMRPEYTRLFLAGKFYAPSDDGA